jgi:hypothetical protein
MFLHKYTVYVMCNYLQRRVNWDNLAHGANWRNLFLTSQKNRNHISPFKFNPFTASCENAMTLSVPGVPAFCEKFPHSQVNEKSH